MNQVIELETWQISKHCLLPCSNCETWTNHALNRTGEFYACSCGEIIDIEIKETAK